MFKSVAIVLAAMAATAFGLPDAPKPETSAAPRKAIGDLLANIEIIDNSHGNLVDRYRGFKPCQTSTLLDMFGQSWLNANVDGANGVGVSCPFAFNVPLYGDFSGDIHFGITPCPPQIVAGVDSNALTKNFVVEPSVSIPIIPFIADLGCDLGESSTGMLTITCGLDFPGTWLDLKKVVNLGFTCDDLAAAFI